MNQEDIVLEYLKSGKRLNKTVAFDELVIQHLGGVVSRLREQGFDIEKDMDICEKTGRNMAFYYL